MTLHKIKLGYFFGSFQKVVWNLKNESTTSRQAHEASIGYLFFTFRGTPRRIKLHNMDQNIKILNASKSLLTNPLTPEYPALYFESIYWLHHTQKKHSQFRSVLNFSFESPSS